MALLTRLQRVTWCHSVPVPAIGAAVLVFGLCLMGWAALTWRRHPWHRGPVVLVGVAALSGLVLRAVAVCGIPAFCSPDEHAHLRYVQHIAENRSLPVQDPRPAEDQNEFWQPPLYYLFLTPFYLVASRLAGSEVGTLLALRVTSVFLWGVTLGLALCFASRVIPGDSDLHPVCILPICLLPSYVVLSSVLNNDNLLVALGAALLCLAVRGDVSWRSSLLTGLLLGAALLTKLTAVVYVPFLALVSAREAWSARALGPRLAAIGKLCLVLGTAGLVLLPWAVRNLGLYDDPLGTTAGANIRYAWQSVWQAATCSWDYMVWSFWACAGPYNNVNGRIFASAGAWVGLFASAGLVWRLVALRHGDVDGPMSREAFLVVAMAVAVAINALLLLRFGLLYNQAQGRHLYGLLPCISLLMAYGLQAYRVPRLAWHLTGAYVAFAGSFLAYALVVLRCGASGGPSL